MANIVVIPEKFYAGMIKRESDELPLGFITPWGEDSSAKKRIATVDSWARQGNRYNSTSKVEAQIINNIPLNGFKFTSSIRNSGYGGHDKWRIEDPRGFELEITSGNLAQLMSVGMIDRGEIIDQCIWARQGANNILLSTSTNEYKEATNNTSIANNSASWTNVKLGDTVILQNTLNGIWLGRMYPIYKGYNNNSTSSLGDNELIHDTKMLHVIYVTNITPKYSGGKTSELHLIASPKLSSIIPCDSTLSKKDAELLANQYLTDKSVHVINSSYKSELLLSFGKAKFTLELVPFRINSSKELNELLGYDKNNVFINIKGNFGKLSSNDRYNQHLNSFKIQIYDFDSLEKNELREKLKYSGSYYNGCSYRYSLEDYEFDSSHNFYNLQLTATTTEGNIIKRMIK